MIETGVVDGTFTHVDVDLVVFDILLLAHGSTLKHWHFGPNYSPDDYIWLQTRHVLSSLGVT